MRIDAVDIAAGEGILFSLAGPTSDLARYSDPARFDVTRPVGKQFAFGAGPHYCVGSNLAKLVMDVAIERFLVRCPHAASAAEPPATSWHESTFAGYTNLPVRLTGDPA
jgi:cytochrome P450